MIEHQVFDETGYNLFVSCLLGAAGVGNFHIFCSSQVHSLPKLGGLNFRICFRLGQF